MSSQYISKVAKYFSQKILRQAQDPEQRQNFSIFYNEFRIKLQEILSEMLGDIFILRERHFDKKLLHLLAKSYAQLESFKKDLNEDNPYKATEVAEKFIQYVTQRPNGPILENLDYLARHHLKNTNETFKPGLGLVQPEINSIKNLHKLANWVGQFIQANPVLKPIRISNLPPSLEENVRDIGVEQKSNPEDITKV